MGEAKRRAKQDPNFGQPPKIKVQIKGIDQISEDVASSAPALWEANGFVVGGEVSWGSLQEEILILAHIEPYTGELRVQRNALTGILKRHFMDRDRAYQAFIQAENQALQEIVFSGEAKDIKIYRGN